MFESTVYLTYRPAFPWSEGALGLIALGAVAALLVALTLWTYLGDPQASRRRIALLIGIRLAALLVAILTLLRPSLAIEEDPRLPSRLVILADASESMTVQDEFNNQTRWQALQQVLKRCEPILQELRDEQNIQVDIYRFAGDFDPEKDKYDPDGRADGPRTDFGTTLANLYAKYQSETDPIRALVILSDGADNGTRRPALAEAARWGNLSPIRTFGLGQATTSSDVRDIAVTSISPDPSPVPIKGKLTVKALVNAPGFERAKVKMTLLFDDKEVKKDAA
ncbi:MAG TPA: vWA domain-containing protein, partial [Gemmataceae bacterium]